MIFLVAGDWSSDIHEEALSNALVQLGHVVHRFKWSSYFSRDRGPRGSALNSVWQRGQNKYLFGPLFRRLNDDLVNLAELRRPDVLFIYRGTHLTKQTLRRIRSKSPRVKIVTFNNDNPFSNGHVYGLWRHFRDALSEVDLALAFRHSNLAELKSAGARNVALLRSWYIPDRHRPLALDVRDRQRFSCDVVFAGHYEPDFRTACLEEVVRQGWELKLFGPSHGWDSAVARSSVLAKLAPVAPVHGDDYVRALRGARVALCFLSKLNRDTYTQRSFEIPACGTLMLSEFSHDLATMFAPGLEADYFRSPRELVDRLKLYLSDDELRTRVAAAGSKRVASDGHDVVSRARELVGYLLDLKAREHGDVRGLERG